MLKLDSASISGTIAEKTPFMTVGGMQLYTTVHGTVMLNTFGEYYLLSDVEKATFLSNAQTSNFKQRIFG